MQLLFGSPPRATQLLITTQPAFHSGAASATFGISPVVKAYLADGTTVATSYTGTVTAALATANGATLGTTVSVACVAGVATFDDLDIDTAGAYQLVFTADGLTSATSDWFMVGAALLLRADAGVSDTGGLVDTWADQSGNGRDAAGVTTARPTVSAVPDLDWDGNDYMTVTGFVRENNIARTAVTVVKSDASGTAVLHSNRSGASVDGTNGHTFFVGSGNALAYALSGGGAFWASDDTVDATDWISLAVSNDGTGDADATTFFSNGVAMATSRTSGSTTGGSGAGPLVISRANTLWLTGKNAALVWFDSELSAPQVAAVHNALRALVAGFATPITLPAA